MRALLLVGLVGCAGAPSDEDADPSIDDNLGVVEDDGSDVCDNLDGEGHCLLPFPSDHWRVDGRLALPSAALPDDATGTPMSSDGFDADGFGVASPVMFQLAGATLQGLPPVFDVAPSLAPEARTVLVDAATGARIPHWVEHDWMDEGADRILVIRPAVALPDGARIVVGVRGLVDSAGSEVDAPVGFAALRDGTASTRKGVHARRARYEAEVFPVLEAAGFPRDELQLAWDFTTRTDASAERDLSEVLAAVDAALGDGPPNVARVDVQEVVGDPNLAWILDVVLEVPSVLGPPDDVGVRRLRRDADGRVVAEGVESVELRVQVPPSVVSGDGPAAVLQYGHGFLGGRGEADNGWLREMAQRYRFVIAAIDMQGMSSRNTQIWASVLVTDAGRMGELADEPLQGIANHVAVQALFARGWGDEVPAPLLRGDVPAWSPEDLWYHGNSQGGTMGTVVLASSRYVTRGVLGVPGCSFPLLLQRSSVFVAWKSVLGVAFADPGELTLLLGLLGTGWDRVEGLTWADRLADPLPGLPAHQALLHVALEDAQVQNDVSWILARAVGAVQPEAQARSVWGVPTVALPATDVAAAVVNWDFGIAPDATPEDPPVDATDTHGWSRRAPAAQEQSLQFLANGRLVDTCGGPCTVPPP